MVSRESLAGSILTVAAEERAWQALLFIACLKFSTYNYQLEESFRNFKIFLPF